MKPEFEKTSKNPIKESSQTEAESTEDVKQGTEEEIERDEFYKRKAAARKDERSATFQRLFIRAMPYLFWTVFWAVIGIATLTVSGIILVRVWHLVGPECCVWLGEEKLSDIDKMLGAALGGGFIGSRLQKFFPEKPSLK